MAKKKDKDQRREPPELSVGPDGKVPCHFCGKRGAISYFVRHYCFKRTWYCQEHKGYATVRSA